MDNIPPEAYRAAEAADAAREVRRLKLKVDAIMRYLHQSGQIEECGTCHGWGYVAPATLVPCTACLGAGFIGSAQ